MPTYDYRCEACRHEMEVFQSMSAERLTKCPACGESRLRRLIGSGAGIIFKGSGFYETDYKRSRSPSSKPSEQTSEKTSEKKSEKKPDRPKKKSDD